MSPVVSDRGASPRHPDGVRASRIPVEPGPQAQESRRRAKRAAVLLGLVAVAFYVGFIVLTFFRSQH